MTPHPYNNKQDYKGVTNDKTRDSHTRVTSVSRSDDDSLAINLDAENKNTEDDEYIEHPSIKKIKLIPNHMKKSEKDYYLIFLLKVIDLVLFDNDNHEKEILAVNLQKQNN